MTAPLKHPLGSPAPCDLRKPRLRFHWRCPECQYEWHGPVQDAHHCGVYAVDADEETE
jgi:hypothetical protein